MLEKNLCSLQPSPVRRDGAWANTAPMLRRAAPAPQFADGAESSLDSGEAVPLKTCLSGGCQATLPALVTLPAIWRTREVSGQPEHSRRALSPETTSAGCYVLFVITPNRKKSGVQITIGIGLFGKLAAKDDWFHFVNSIRYMKLRSEYEFIRSILETLELLPSSFTRLRLFTAGKLSMQASTAGCNVQ